MLSLDEILKHYSSSESRYPRAVLKEYLQYKLLEIIYSSRFGEHMIFMGGTAARIVYGNDRFSEDLDLDNTNLAKTDFADLIAHTALELKKEGIETEARNVFKGVYRCYLKFPRLLFREKLSPLPDEKILIQIDSFPTPEELRPISRIINKADIFTEVKVYPPDLILAQKIFALLNRTRAKGRDFYDIVYLSSLAEPDWAYLEKQAGITDKKTLAQKISKLFTADELKKLAGDVEPFLINPQKILVIEKFHDWLDQYSRDQASN